MRVVIFQSKAIALALSALVNTRLGYPKPGVDIGGGLHASASDSQTTSHALVLDHPDGTRHGYVIFGAGGLSAFRAIRTALQAKVQAGTATAGETALANAPDDTDTDDTWFAGGP